MKIDITLQGEEIEKFRQMNDETDFSLALKNQQLYECLVCERGRGFVWSKLYNAIVGSGSMYSEDCTSECEDKMQIRFFTEKRLSERQFRDKFFTPYPDKLSNSKVIVYNCGTITIYDSDISNEKVYILKEALKPEKVTETNFDKFYYKQSTNKEVDYNMTVRLSDGTYKIYYYTKEYKDIRKLKTLFSE